MIKVPLVGLPTSQKSTKHTFDVLGLKFIRVTMRYAPSLYLIDFEVGLSFRDPHMRSIPFFFKKTMVRPDGAHPLAFNPEIFSVFASR